MKVLNTDNAVFFDVDDTLVMWEKCSKYKKKVKVVCPNTSVKEKLFINSDHVKLLKKMKGKGRTIVVWSHGGYAWAEAVVKALELEDHVDMVMTKVEDYVDDLKLDEWCAKNIYLHNGYGR